MLERGMTFVQDEDNPISVCVEGDGRHHETLVCQVNGTGPRSDAERHEDCRTIVAALNNHLNDSSVLLIDEAGGISLFAAIDDSIIAAINNGIMDAVRFHDGNFQQHDGTEWVTLKEEFYGPTE